MEQFEQNFLDPPCLNHSMDGRRSFSDFDNSSPSGAAPDVTSFRLDKSYCSTSGLLDKNSTVEGTRAAWETWEITKVYFNLAWLLMLSRYWTVASEQQYWGVWISQAFQPDGYNRVFASLWADSHGWWHEQSRRWMKWESASKARWWEWESSFLVPGPLPACFAGWLISRDFRLDYD